MKIVVAIIIIIIIIAPSVIGTKNGRRRSSEVNIKTVPASQEHHHPKTTIERTVNKNQCYSKMSVSKRAIWFSNCDTRRSEGKAKLRKFILKNFVRCPISNELCLLCTPAQVLACASGTLSVCLLVSLLARSLAYLLGVSRFWGICDCVFLLRSFIWSYLSSIIINYCRDCFWIEIDQRDKSHGLTPCSASMNENNTRTHTVYVECE